MTSRSQLIKEFEELIIKKHEIDTRIAKLRKQLGARREVPNKPIAIPKPNDIPFKRKPGERVSVEHVLDYFLTKGSATRKQLVEYFQFSNSSQHIQKLLKQGLIRKIGPGAYELNPAKQSHIVEGD